MKYVLLLILSCFIFSDVLAKDISILNPCTNANIPLNKALSDKSILINKEVGSKNEKMFLISYLDNNGSICYDKKYDILFKVKNQYI
ncbi:hypothetical protein [Rodentibacter genomosp. 2]|uniref:hypothetical protein n=1 Tax=Rodentibacter genomosp. 2 TaxID=1908266 RepID=UPI000987C000